MIQEGHTCIVGDAEPLPVMENNVHEIHETQLDSHIAADSPHIVPHDYNDYSEFDDHLPHHHHQYHHHHHTLPPHPHHQQNSKRNVKETPI